MKVMTDTERAVSDFASLTTLDVDFDSVFDILSNSRRRFVISCLNDYSNPLTLRDISIRLAAWEDNVPVADVPKEEIEPVYLELYHVHIPRLGDANVVEYDRNQDTIALVESGDEIAAYTGLAQVDQ